MGETTGIDWTDHTFSPWIGCTKVSLGAQGACENCYAEELALRYGWVTGFGNEHERKRTAASTWTKPRAWDRAAAKAGEVRTVFPSLLDPFDNKAPAEWRAAFFALIRETPNLVWLLLSKRIGNAVEMSMAAGGLPDNVALGSTFANQPEYDRDRMKLRHAREDLGALFTFGSFEPLLGEVILDKNAPDWIIVGGESGRNARPMNPDWVRKLRDQSAELKRAFFFKQWGGLTPKSAGKSLDGREWCDRPTIKKQQTELFA